MKNNLPKIIAGLILIIAGVLIYKYSNSIEDQKGPSASDIISQLEAADQNVNQLLPQAPESAEIKFKKSIFIKTGFYSVDGGELIKIPCNSQGVEFGRIQLNKKMMGSLNCIEEYMGGVFLSYDTDDMQNGKIPLAQTDGDAGDHWDSAALIYKDGENVKIEFITHMTSVEFDSKNPAVCEIMQNAVEWDEDKKVFSLAKFSGVFKEKLFPTPDASDCKNKKWTYK